MKGLMAPGQRSRYIGGLEYFNSWFNIIKVLNLNFILNEGTIRPSLADSDQSGL
jgi:hypothetical protein